MKKKKINSLFIVLCFLSTNNSLQAAECPPEALLYSTRIFAGVLISAPLIHLVRTWSMQPLIYKVCAPYLFTFAFYGTVETAKSFVKIASMAR